jgi:CRISPR/Cas system-associated endonuclease Cas1
MEPYLGFLHSVQYGKPSLVCDLQELYRYLIDDFVMEFCQGLKSRDFVVKGERTTRKRWGKREYLNSSKTRELERGLNELFENWVKVPRIKHGSRQTLGTLINEEALLLAKYLRDEKQCWIPRIPSARASPINWHDRRWSDRYREMIFSISDYLHHPPRALR